MNYWGIMEHKRAGIFETPEFQPYQDRWQERLKELDRRRRYYDGSIYHPMFRYLQQSQEFSWMWPSLYRGIKPLYLPLSRAVDVDAGIIPGSWALPEEAPNTWQTAIDQVFQWSNWQRDGVLYIHYGAMYGLGGLKIVDQREAKRLSIQPVNPQSFLLIEAGDYDDTPVMAIAIEIRMNREGTEYEYAEVITPDQVRTFYDGKPFGYEMREPEYKNELGFVPYVESQHIKTGEVLGEATYQKAIPLLDEVNQLASYFADMIGKHAEPQWVAIGAEASELVKAGDNVWFMPDGSDVKPLVAQVDFQGILAFIQEIRDQVHGALPELSFDELRKKEAIATATLELQLMELVLKVKRCRPNYDHGLADALRMAGKAAASMSIAGLGVLDDELLAFDEERPVLPLDPKTAMELELQEISLERMRALDQVEPGPDEPRQPSQNEADADEPVEEPNA